MTSAMSRQVAVVGCGQWGKNLLRDFANLQALCAVADSCPSAGEEAARELFKPSYSVAVRDWTGYWRVHPWLPLCSQHQLPNMPAWPLRLSKPRKIVFIDKPMVLSAIYGEKICKATLQTHKIAVVDHSYRYYPAFMELQAIVN